MHPGLASIGLLRFHAQIRATGTPDSRGRAFRLLQLSGLVDIDLGDDATSDRANTASIHQHGMPDASWRETEEKRRTVWASFILGRLPGMLNDRPRALHEELVSPLTLPATRALVLLLCPCADG